MISVASVTPSASYHVAHATRVGQRGSEWYCNASAYISNSFIRIHSSSFMTTITTTSLHHPYSSVASTSRAQRIIALQRSHYSAQLIHNGLSHRLTHRSDHVTHRHVMRTMVATSLTQCHTHHLHISRQHSNSSAFTLHVSWHSYRYQQSYINFTLITFIVSRSNYCICAVATLYIWLRSTLL